MMSQALLKGICLLPLLTAPPTKAPLPAREAPMAMSLPDGFNVTLFAGEPDIKQPIAFCFDDRGRLWVVECFSYPGWQKDPKQKGTDRIVILEDTDGDGSFNKRTVFADNLPNLSGIQYGFGGVWLCSLPNVLFIPDADGDDRPDGPPVVKLDGWSLECRHNVFNSLKWGPDGWLYGCNGIVATSRVGVPGTPDNERVQINCGVWRFHPTKNKFEAYAHGTTNPWGLDWDEYGEMFITNCVIEHLWHVVPGAHFKRMYGNHFNPNLYGLMQTCADHIHWAGGAWQSSRAPIKVSESLETKYSAHSDAGGGHAHVGCMIYLGDNFPRAYRNGVFTCNLHGNRINHDILERKGSSYVARHGKDFLFANDPWFRGLAIDYGPDGGVFVTDWCDTGECHNYDVAHTSTGRIYKITHSKIKHQPVDLQKLSDRELIDLQLSSNEWMVRHARRILHERAAANKLDPNTAAAINKVLASVADNEKGADLKRLRLYWAQYVMGLLPDTLQWRMSADRSEDVRTWAVRLMLDDGNPNNNGTLERLAQLARTESSPKVRLALASGIQRLPDKMKGIIAYPLVVNHDDSEDEPLSHMLWYGIEAIPTHNFELACHMLVDTRSSFLRERMVRRIASLDGESYAKLMPFLAENKSAPIQRDLLRGLQQALNGRRTVKAPRDWENIYPTLIESPLPEVRERALALAVLFGDARALASLRSIVLDQTTALVQRQQALKTLVQRREKSLLPLLQKLLADDAMRGPALRGLAVFEDTQTPAMILNLYGKLSDAEKVDAVTTLASRPTFALALLDAVADKKVPRADLNLILVRQMLALKNKTVSARVNDVWGTIRPPSQEKKGLIARYKKQLSDEILARADRSRGRLVFAKHCAACHRLFDEGGAIGPDITGSQRANLDYVLENIIDPSAAVPREYRVSIILTNSGRVLTGIVKQETDQAITVQTQNEVVVVPRDEIEQRSDTTKSMMPEGVLDNLPADQIRDLVAYLASPYQVPKSSAPLK